MLISSLSAEGTFSLIKHVLVVRVIDGDTLAVVSQGKHFKVRLLGIQAPELFVKPVQVFALQAKQELAKLVNQRYVDLYYVVNHKYDKYGRILADIYYKNIWINGYLISHGLAYVYFLHGADIPKIKKLYALEDKAILQHLSFWQQDIFKVIVADSADKYLLQYKVIDGKIYAIKHTKKSIWLMLTQKYAYGFSLRIKATDEKLFLQQLKIKSFNSLKNKDIRVRGFIEKFSQEFGAFIDIEDINSLDFKQKVSLLKDN